MQIEAETLWCDVNNSFHTEAVRSWNKLTLLSWENILSTQGTMISSDRSTSRTEKLIEILNRDRHQGLINRRHDHGIVAQSNDRKDSAELEKRNEDAETETEPTSTVGIRGIPNYPHKSWRRRQPQMETPMVMMKTRHQMETFSIESRMHTENQMMVQHP